MSGTSANKIRDQFASPCASGEVSQLERRMPKILSHTNGSWQFLRGKPTAYSQLSGCFSLEDNGKERRLSFATDDIEYAKRYQEAELRVLCCVMEESRQGLVPVHRFTAACRGSSERA